MKENGSLGVIVPFLKTKNASVLKQFEENQWRQFDGPAKDATIIFGHDMDIHALKILMSLMWIYWLIVGEKNLVVRSR